MKIMFFATVYEYGGVSSVIRNILNNLDREKFNIVFLVERLASKHYSIREDIKLINMDITPKKGFFSKVFNIVRHIISIRRHIVNEAPNMVISFATYANCYLLLSLLFSSKGRPKIIISEHSEEIFVEVKGRNTKYAVFKAIYRVLMGFLYHRADYIVTVSKSIASHVKKIFFVSPDKIKVIYNPVDIDKIKELAAEGLSIEFEDALPYIGTISRLAPEKGIRFLIEAFKDLLNKIDARLIVIGDGTDRLQLEKITKDLGIEEKVIFTGYIDNPFKYLVKMDIFVLPSLWEGFPNVVLEAMACRVVVVTSDSAGGVREVIKNGINGLLIKPNSSSAISEALCYLLTNKEKRENMIAQACEDVKQFSVDKIKKQYEDLIFN